MSECIFCKIASREIPSEKVYEDAKFFAFLDIHPASKGHTVIISKDHFENIFDGKENELSELGVALKKVSGLLKKKYKCDGVNLLNNSGKAAGQEVPHFHFHVIPRYSENSKVLESPEKKAISEEAVLRKVREIGENKKSSKKN